jgi:hypothetical protein
MIFLELKVLNFIFPDIVSDPESANNTHQDEIVIPCEQTSQWK